MLGELNRRPARGRDAPGERPPRARRIASPRSFLPLRGCESSDVTSSLAGPFCTEVLAALGADVVKIERGVGDEARHLGAAVVERGEHRSSCP